MSDATTHKSLSRLLQHSLSLDIVGDATVAVRRPGELIEWTDLLAHPLIVAWRCADTGSRFVDAYARQASPPINGHVTIHFLCEDHLEFWAALVTGDLALGVEREIDRRALRSAYNRTGPDLQRHLTPEPATA